MKWGGIAKIASVFHCWACIDFFGEYCPATHQWIYWRIYDVLNGLFNADF
jgi:hypothetical protein